MMARRECAAGKSGAMQPESPFGSPMVRGNGGGGAAGQLAVVRFLRGGGASPAAAVIITPRTQKCADPDPHGMMHRLTIVPYAC